MNEQELSIKLTEAEERLRAWSKRLEAVERRQDDIEKLATAMQVFDVRQKSMEDVVKEIKADVKSIKEKPGRRFDALVDRALYLLVGVVFSALVMGAA